MTLAVMHPVVNQDSCDGCENCAEVCPSEVYVMTEGRARAVRAEECIECWACVEQCPTDSIVLRDD